jgi:hypothetical protein
MASYTAQTRFSPAKIIERASKHFGAIAGAMKTTSKTDTSLCLESLDGYVTITVCPGEGKAKNTLDIETSQFDEQAREFLRSL